MNTHTVWYDDRCSWFNGLNARTKSFVKSLKCHKSEAEALFSFGSFVWAVIQKYRRNNHQLAPHVSLSTISEGRINILFHSVRPFDVHNQSSVRASCRAAVVSSYSAHVTCRTGNTLHTDEQQQAHTGRTYSWEQALRNNWGVTPKVTSIKITHWRSYLQV